MQKNSIDWEFNQFLTVNEDLTDIPFTEEELIGVAYLKSVRDEVVKRKFSYLASFDGRHRSGKSIGAASLADIWDPKFFDEMQYRIVQHHTEFADVLERIEKSGQKGAVIMVDEAGASMGSSDWYEGWMKNLSKSVMVLGYLLPIILFVAPVKDFVDARLRKMFHAYYKVDRPTDHGNRTFSYLTPYRMKYNSIYKKPYHQKPIIRIMGEKKTVKRLKLFASSQVVERYAELELHRKPKMLEEFYKGIRHQEVKKQREMPNIEEIANFVVKNYKSFEAETSKPEKIVIDGDLVKANYTNLTFRLANTVKKKAQKILSEKQREFAEKKQREE